MSGEQSALRVKLACTCLLKFRSSFIPPILNEHLYDNVNAMHGRRWVFQQDNDPKHTSHDVKSDLETHLPGQVLLWPSYSPDLNPIKNVWAILKKKMLRRGAQKKINHK
jgi:hypothetical protein